MMALFAQLCKERRLRLLPGNSKGHSQVNSSEYMKRVDYQQPYEEEKTQCSATIQSMSCC